MRFDKPIYFQTVVPGEYDAGTGNYKKDTITEEKKFASVQDSKVDTLHLIYGEIRQGSLTITLQMPYEKAFDRIRYGSKLYKVDYQRQHRTKHVFVVSEVQHGKN